MSFVALMVTFTRVRTHNTSIFTIQKESFLLSVCIIKTLFSYNFLWCCHWMFLGFEWRLCFCVDAFFLLKKPLRHGISFFAVAKYLTYFLMLLPLRLKSPSLFRIQQQHQPPATSSITTHTIRKTHFCVFNVQFGMGCSFVC